MSETDGCVMCISMEALGMDCPYCNGTGESNSAAIAFMKHHICQCRTFDRKHCPICRKDCHHSTNCNPKMIIGGGYE